MTVTDQRVLATKWRDEPADGHPDAHVHVGGLPVAAHCGTRLSPRPATWIPYVRYKLIHSGPDRSWLLLAEDDMHGWISIARVLTAPSELSGQHDLVAMAGDAPLLDRGQAYLVTHQAAGASSGSTCTMILTAVPATAEC